MSNDGSMNEQIRKCVQSSLNMSGWVLRTFATRDAVTMKTLFKSLILSKLDYCSPLVIPASANEINSMEKVQRAFTRRIAGMSGKTYPERLIELKMLSIQRRRERFIIIYMFKILNNLVHNPGITFKSNERTGTHAIIPTMKTTEPNYKRKLRFNSFGYLGPKLFEILPKSLRSFEAPSNVTNLTLAFKTHLDKFLEKIPDQPTIPGLSRSANSNSLSDQIHYKMSN